jgi:hypothetical protein
VESLAGGDIYLMRLTEYGLDLEAGWQNTAEQERKGKILPNFILKTIHVCHL